MTRLYAEEEKRRRVEVEVNKNPRRLYVEEFHKVKQRRNIKGFLCNKILQPCFCKDSIMYCQLKNIDRFCLEVKKIHTDASINAN